MPAGVAVSAATAAEAAAVAEAGDDDGKVENDRFGRLLKSGRRREAKGTAILRETTARIDEDTVSFVVRHARQASDGRHVTEKVQRLLVSLSLWNVLETLRHWLMTLGGAVTSQSHTLVRMFKKRRKHGAAYVCVARLCAGWRITRWHSVSHVDIIKVTYL